MTNAEMKANRFLKMYRGRKLFAAMNEAWNRGATVNVCTATRIFAIKPNARALISLGASGSLYMASGKRRDCIDFARVVVEG